MYSGLLEIIVDVFHETAVSILVYGRPNKNASESSINAQSGLAPESDLSGT